MKSGNYVEHTIAWWLSARCSHQFTVTASMAWWTVTIVSAGCVQTASLNTRHR